jgi:V8-like Glu-specific endopeptidase
MKTKLPLLPLMALVSLVSSLNASNLGPVTLSDAQVEQYPFSTAGLLVATAGWTGSAAAVGNRTALTCAHNIFDPDTNQLAASVYRYLPKNNSPANAGAAFDGSTPQSKVVLSKVYFDDYGAQAAISGTSDASFNRDFAILIFAEDLGQDIAVYGRNRGADNALYNIVGYPADEKIIPVANIYKMHGTNGTEGNVDTPEKINPSENRLIQSALYTSGGNSGGPVFRFNGGGAGPAHELVGILVGGPADITGTKFSIWTEVDDVIFNAIAAFAANPLGTDTPISSSVPLGAPSTPQPNPPASGGSGAGGDGNNTAEGATTITIGSTIGGTLSDGDDLDFFRFYLPAQGEFVAYTTGTTDTYGIIYDGQGQVLAEADGGGSDALNFRITASGAPAWYFIEVSSGSGQGGSYSLGVSSVVDPSGDTNNAIGQAEPLDMQIFEQPGLSVFPTWSGTYVETTLHEGDSDFYSFTIDQVGTVLILTYGDIDTAAVLYDANFAAIAEVDDSILGEDVFMELVLAPGAYTLEVKASNGVASGEYGVDVRHFPLIAPFATEDPNDTFGESFLIEERDYLSTNRNIVSGTLGVAGTKDFYVLELDQAADITVIFQNGLGQVALINLFDEEVTSKGLASNDATATFLQASGLTEGYYLIRVEVPPVAQSVPYQLAVNIVPDENASTQSLTDGYYIVQNATSGAVLLADPESSSIGALSVDAGEEQEWLLVSVGNGLFAIGSDETEQIMEVQGGSVAEGALIVQNADIGNANQLWELVRTSDGSYRLVASHSGKVLSIREDGIAVQRNYQAGTGQTWTLELTEALDEE